MLLVLASVPAVVVTSAVQYLNTRNSIHEQAMGQLSGLNEAKKQHLQSYFRDLRLTLETLSTDVQITDIFNGATSALNAVAVESQMYDGTEKPCTSTTTRPVSGPAMS